MNKVGKRIITSLLLLAIMFGSFSVYPTQVFAVYQEIEYDDGDIYKGNVLANGKKNGSGTYTCNDGTVITGTWKENVLSGKAKIEYPDGDKYVGNINNGKKSGKGTYYYDDGDVYKGTWKNDKRNGKGKYIWDNGWVLSGNWRKGKLNGKCKLKLTRYTYTIQFKNGKLKKVISRR